MARTDGSVVPGGGGRHGKARLPAALAAAVLVAVFATGVGLLRFGTIVMPQAHNLDQNSFASGDTVVTKVLVRDASAPEPSGVSPQ